MRIAKNVLFFNDFRFLPTALVHDELWHDPRASGRVPASAGDPAPSRRTAPAGRSPTAQTDRGTGTRDQGRGQTISPGRGTG